jgi:hypothetical protein
MAFGAIGILGVMELGEATLIMTLQALLPIERDALTRRWASVGIVTGGAGKAIAGFLLAAASEQSFPLANSASAGAVLAFAREESRIVEQVVARAEVLRTFVSAINGNLALKVAIETDGIAAHSIETGNLEHVHSAARGKMRAGITMAGLASDSASGKRLIAVMVACVGKGRNRARCMAVQATGIDGKCERHLLGVLIAWRHVPQIQGGVPVDRRFEPVTVLLEEVCAAALARAKKVQELLMSFEFARTVIALITEPDFPRLLRDAVLNAGLRVTEFAGLET